MGSKKDAKNDGSVSYLARNVGLLTASNFASKIMVFFLVPLYTSVLTTEEYGTFDLYNTTISLLVPLLTANIAEAVLRFSLDNNANHNAIFAVGIRYTLMSVLAVVVGVLAFVFLGIGDNFVHWWPLFILLYIAHALLALISNFARGIDCVREVAIAGVIATLTLVGFNVFFLLEMGIGLFGYFLASILSTFSQIISLIIGTKAWRYMGEGIDHSLASDMRLYGMPLAANSIAWWVNMVSDRYVITGFCGMGANGVYAVAGKIPQMLNVMQTIFTQAWVLSAVREANSDNEGEFFSKTYNTYECLMVLVCAALITLDKFIAKIMYAADFYAAWQFVPFLLIAIMFGALSGHLGGAFAAARDSRAYARTTVVGAVVNVAANLVIVPVMGPMGAAISTVISYWVVWVMRRRLVLSYVNARFRIVRDYISYALLLMQSAITLLVNDMPLMYCLQLLCLAGLLVLYMPELGTWGRLIRAFSDKVKHRQ